MKFKIKYVDSIPRGYIGMNYFAAKELGIEFPKQKYLIWILKGRSKSSNRITITHEKAEIAFMMKGKKYHEAHILSNTIEEVY